MLKRRSIAVFAVVAALAALTVCGAEPSGSASSSMYNSGSWSDRRPYWNGPTPWPEAPGFQPPPDTTNEEPPAVSPRAEIELAQARMLEASIRLEKQFEASDAYRKALRDLREAERDLDLARSQAHRALQDSRDYHLALAAERQAARNVEAVQASYREPPSAPPATQPFPLPLVMAAQHKLDASRQLSEIESEALANNPAVKNARARLEAAADRLETLRAKFEASLVTDPEWLAAKRRLDAARAGLLPEPAIDSSEP